MTGADVYSCLPVVEPISSAELAERVRNRWSYVYPESPERFLALVRSHLTRMHRAGKVEMLHGEDGPVWRRAPKAARKRAPRLDPPDLKRCQAEKPNGATWATMGGVPGRIRCAETPVVVIEEREKRASDGLRGSMSLCRGCLTVFNSADDARNPGGLPEVYYREIQPNGKLGPRRKEPPCT